MFNVVDFNASLSFEQHVNFARRIFETFLEHADLDDLLLFHKFIFDHIEKKELL